MAEGADVHMSVDRPPLAKLNISAQCYHPFFNGGAGLEKTCAKVAKVANVDEIITESREDKSLPCFDLSWTHNEALQRPITESQGQACAEAFQGPITESQGEACAEILHNRGVNFESLEDALDDLEHDGALEDWHYYWLMQQGKLP